MSVCRSRTPISGRATSSAQPNHNSDTGSDDPRVLVAHRSELCVTEAGVDPTNASPLGRTPSPSGSLESSHYKLFPGIVLSPNGLQASSFIATVTTGFFRPQGTSGRTSEVNWRSPSNRFRPRTGGLRLLKNASPSPLGRGRTQVLSGRRG